MIGPLERRLVGLVDRGEALRRLAALARLLARVGDGQPAVLVDVLRPGRLDGLADGLGHAARLDEQADLVAAVQLQGYPGLHHRVAVAPELGRLGVEVGHLEIVEVRDLAADAVAGHPELGGRVTDASCECCHAAVLLSSWIDAGDQSGSAGSYLRDSVPPTARQAYDTPQRSQSGPGLATNRPAWTACSNISSSRVKNGTE